MLMVNSEYNNGSNIGDNEGEMGSIMLTSVLLLRKQITSGDDHTCAILDNDLVMCWGANNFGQVGDGTTNQLTRQVYVRPFIGANVYSIDTRPSLHTCALLNDGSIVVGVETSMVNSVQGHPAIQPILLKMFTYGHPNTRDVVAIKAGDMHTCAVLEAIKPSRVGENGDGQLGIAGVSQLVTPRLPNMGSYWNNICKSWKIRTKR